MQNKTKKKKKIYGYIKSFVKEFGDFSLWHECTWELYKLTVEKIRQTYNLIMQLAFGDIRLFTIKEQQDHREASTLPIAT